MAAGEHHAKRSSLIALAPKSSSMMGATVHSLSSNRPSSGAKVRAVLCGGHKPRGGVLRQSAEFPHLERTAEGVLYHVFRQREVLDSKDARQRGDHAPRFAPKQMVAGIDHMF